MGGAATNLQVDDEDDAQVHDVQPQGVPNGHQQGPNIINAEMESIRQPNSSGLGSGPARTAGRVPGHDVFGRPGDAHLDEKLFDERQRPIMTSAPKATALSPMDRARVENLSW